MHMHHTHPAIAYETLTLRALEDRLYTISQQLIRVRMVQSIVHWVNDFFSVNVYLCWLLHEIFQRVR